MRKLALIPVLAIVIMAIVVPSCKKETVTKIAEIKTLTLYATKDASIFNGTTAYDPNGIDGQYNDYGSGGSDILRVGYSDNSEFLIRTLVAFDVSSIPANAKILTANLTFTAAKLGNNAPALEIHKVNEAWTEGTTREDPADRCLWNETYCAIPGVAITTTDVSWTHANFNTTAWTTPGGAFVAAASATVSNGGTMVFSSEGIITDVQAWMATPASNFGWLVKANEANITANGGEQVRYLSREAAANGAAADTKPRLIIQYSEQ